MRTLVLQMGAGLYARIEPQIDGFVTVQFCEVTSGMFYPVTNAQGKAIPPQSVFIALWDGNGWHPDVLLLAKHLRKGQPTQSAILQAELNVIAQQSHRKLKEIWIKAIKTPEDEIEMARCTQYAARGGYISEVTLRRWATQPQVPLVMRKVIMNELAARTGG